MLLFIGGRSGQIVAVSPTRRLASETESGTQRGDLMADAAMFRAGLRACGMSVSEYSEHFGVPIGQVRTWKKRGAPEAEMSRLARLYFDITETDLGGAELPRGCWEMANFLIGYRHV